MPAAVAKKAAAAEVLAYAITSTGSGPERKYQALRLTLSGDTVVKTETLETSRWRDLCEDAARRALWGKAGK